jgi:hypothetical protein
MGQKQDLKDQKPESSVEHEIKSSSTSEAGQLPADSHDRKQLETDPPDSDRRFKAVCVSKLYVIIALMTHDNWRPTTVWLKHTQHMLLSSCQGSLTLLTFTR